MRLLLALLFFLHITLSVAPFIPHAASEAGDAGDGAASDGAAGDGATGDGAPADPSDDDSSGDGTDSDCTIYSCPSGETYPGESGSSGSAPDSDSGDENEAAEVIEHINDVLDMIESITSLITSSDSSTYTITTTASLPTAARPCLSAQSIYSACGDSSGGDFTDQVVSQQASCLCYQQLGGVNRTTTWVPGWFDGFVSQCDEFVATQTAVSVSASVTGAATVGATGICKSVGDVRASASASASVARQVAATRSSNTAVPSPIQTAATSGGMGRVRGIGMAYRGMFLVLGVIIWWVGI